MPDLETRMPELLRRAAAGGPSDPAFERRVLRRARRRRVANASAATLAAVALVAGMVLGARELTPSGHTAPADESMSPSPGTVTLTMYLPAVWPEVTTDTLAAAQDQADAGDVAWRLDPVQTAAVFATDVLGWDPADVQTMLVPGPDHPVRVIVSNLGLGPAEDAATPAPPETIVGLRQLGDRGDGGIWTVTGAETDRIDLDRDVGLPASGPILSGRLVEVSQEWQLGMWPVADGHLVVGPGTGGNVRRDGQRFNAQLALPDELVPLGTSTIGVVLGLYDPEGTIVAAEALPLNVTSVPPTPTGPTGAPGPVPTGSTGPSAEIPTAVLATRDAIAVAASTRDFGALERLIEPNHFSYNFDDASNPVPAWRKDPAVLDILATILQMPFTTKQVDPVGTIYEWPALTTADLTNLTPAETAMLETLGITPVDVQAMLDAFAGYAGPRTGIAEDGPWLFYTIGGD